jgi:multisubunit Na+/H+ antiporter MnhB subunit
MLRFPPHSQLLVALKVVLSLQIVLFLATLFYAYHRIAAPGGAWQNVAATWVTVGGFLLGFGVDLFFLALIFLRAENKKRFLTKGSIALLLLVVGLLVIYAPSIRWASDQSPNMFRDNWKPEDGAS